MNQAGGFIAKSIAAIFIFALLLLLLLEWTQAPHQGNAPMPPLQVATTTPPQQTEKTIYRTVYVKEYVPYYHTETVYVPEPVYYPPPPPPWYR